MIKETEPHHPTLLSLKLKDLLVMLLRTKLLETQIIPFLTLKDLSEESLMTQQFKKILNTGHLK